MHDYIPLPAPPQPQGTHSRTFKQPPLDGTLTIPEMYDWHAEHSPEHPLFIYPDEDGEVKTIKWGAAIRALHRAGRWLNGFVNGNIMTNTSDGPLIAILANSGEVYLLCGLLLRPSTNQSPLFGHQT